MKPTMQPGTNNKDSCNICGLPKMPLMLCKCPKKRSGGSGGGSQAGDDAASGHPSEQTAQQTNIPLNNAKHHLNLRPEFVQVLKLTMTDTMANLDPIHFQWNRHIEQALKNGQLQQLSNLNLIIMLLKLGFGLMALNEKLTQNANQLTSLALKQFDHIQKLYHAVFDAFEKNNPGQTPLDTLNHLMNQNDKVAPLFQELFPEFFPKHALKNKATPLLNPFLTRPSMGEV